MRRPKYLQYADDVQDYISQHPGATIPEIVSGLRLHYHAVQQATALLRKKGRVSTKSKANAANRGRRLLAFHPA